MCSLGANHLVKTGFALHQNGDQVFEIKSDWRHLAQQ